MDSFRACVNPRNPPYWGERESLDPPTVMDRSPSLQPLVAPLRAEVLSGASVVARMASDAIARGADRAVAESVAEFRASIADLGIRILDAQPAMAPLVALLGAVLDAMDGAEDVSAARSAARRAALAFRESLEIHARTLAQRTAVLLPEEGMVLTLSSSSAVRDALLHPARPRRLEVVVLESRPLQEGQLLAAALARHRVPVTVAVDAAAATLASRSSMVLLGADSVGDLGVVNKLGSAAAAHAARRAGVPVMVSTDGSKILPLGFPQHLADDRPGEEVLRAPAGVKVWNRYFEAVPVEDVTWIVTEAGVFGPEELARHRAGLHAPEEVRAWAAQRLRDHPDRSIR